MITERDIEVLSALDRYFVLNRPQIQRLCFPGDKSGRVTRRRLFTLLGDGFVSRGNLVVHHPHAGSPGPVYYPSQRGCEFLAACFDDERHLLTPTQAPQSHHIFHWLEVSETHIAFDAAVSDQSGVLLPNWLNEWDIVNKSEPDAEKRYQLRTIIRRNPPLVCAPDAAFLLSFQGHSKVFYVEQDRGTSGVPRVVASKTPGYAALAEKQLHLKHFPQASVPEFAVLLVAPTEGRRDSLCRAMKGKPGSDLWRFVTTSDLKRPDMLTQPIFFPCRGEPGPLVKMPGSEQSSSAAA